MGAIATTPGRFYDASIHRVVERQWRLFRRLDGSFLAREYVHDTDLNAHHVDEATYEFTGDDKFDELNAFHFKLQTGFDPMKFVN